MLFETAANTARLGSRNEVKETRAKQQTGLSGPQWNFPLRKTCKVWN